MKKLHLAVLPALLLAVIVSCSESVVPRNGDTRSFSRLCDLFASPPAEYGTVPFWVWNDEVTEEEIDLQLKELADAGAGGVFIHPRPGLVTPYLSDRWFELCEYSVHKAEELGIGFGLALPHALRRARQDGMGHGPQVKAGDPCRAAGSGRRPRVCEWLAAGG